MFLVGGVAAAESTGQVVIASSPAGGDASVDGQPVGRTPVTARDLLPGDHLVDVAWLDGTHASAVVSVKVGTSRLVNLRPGDVPSVGTSSPAPSSEATRPPGPGQTSALEGTDEPSPRRGPDTVGRGLLIAGIVLDVLGLAGTAGFAVHHGSTVGIIGLGILAVGVPLTIYGGWRVGTSGHRARSAVLSVGAGSLLVTGTF